MDVEVVWTPHHPEILGASNVPPEGMTQLLQIVETWTAEDGEWHWSDTTRRSDFYKGKPELAPELQVAPPSGGKEGGSTSEKAPAGNG